MPATLVSAGVKPPVHEQIVELQNKIQLLEGDRKAFYESSQWTIKKNRESISGLRQENKKLHKKLSDILAVRSLGGWQGEQSLVYGPGAIEFISHRICEKSNRLNDLKHQVEVRKRRLEELQYKAKVQEARGFQETLRRLENQLEKARLKMEEAEHITSLYRQLKAHMQESLMAQTQLDALEAEILRLQHELQGLRVMNTEAQATRDAAREQLLLQEDGVYQERHMRELKLMELKKQAEERRAQNERAERRQHLLTTINLTPLPESGATFQQLQQLTEQNEEALVRLRAEEEALEAELQDLTYSGETRVTGAQRLLEELRAHLRQEETRRDAAKGRLDKVMRVLLAAQAGVEHLASRVQHIQLVSEREGGRPLAGHQG
uniref:Coiled-coil domain containing 151 n=1 Tax=Pelusios castaneus TaxID=367368 RepID=A0A8C8SSI1_9SAUR